MHALRYGNAGRDLKPHEPHATTNPVTGFRKMSRAFLQEASPVGDVGQHLGEITEAKAPPDGCLVLRSRAPLLGHD